MYDNSDGGLKFRKYCGVSLGWWHTYKHVALTVWKTFAQTIWAPLFHFLYPGETFYPKSKNLTHVLALYQCCMGAYRGICKNLRRDYEDPALSLPVKVAIRELLFVFDYALPVVTLVPMMCLITIACQRENVCVSSFCFLIYKILNIDLP